MGARGASLVGLITIVVALGVLGAGAVVGLRSMTGNDVTVPTTMHLATANAARPSGAASDAARSACTASAEVARTASTVYFAGNGQRYPTVWSEMTSRQAPVFVLASGDVVNRADPKELDGRGWRLFIAGGGSSPPTFTCR